MLVISATRLKELVSLTGHVERGEPPAISDNMPIQEGNERE